MNKTRLILVLLSALISTSAAYAQEEEEDFRKSFENARKGMQKDFDDFRKQALMEYSDFVRKAWKSFNVEPAVPMPQEEEVVPMLAPGADQETASWFGDQMKKLKKKLKGKGKQVPDQVEHPLAQQKAQPKAKDKDKDKDKKDVAAKPTQMPVKEVIKPAPPIKQPEPIAPVKEQPFMANDYMKFDVFGTECKVRIGDDCRFKLKDLQSNTIADIISEEFTKEQYDNMLYDCLQERKRHDFSDWAYYQMLLALTKKFYGENSNEGVLVQAFLYSQSGYKMRIAHDADKLYLLLATHHFIYNKPFFYIDGECYFMLDGKQSDKLAICQASFPKESSLSLQITAAQRLSLNPTGGRTITSIKNPDFTVTIHSNKNYLDFYETYPSSNIDNNFMTRWAMYANTPLESGVRSELYPQLKEKLKGMSEEEAVQQLLWWMHGRLDLEGEIQNSDTFLYRYDEDCWGADRAFFGEETLFYPYCDCEDRSIMLSHLIRDLVGLDVVLVYYPGHLAMAVCFNGNVEGDYIMVDGRKFIVCDPTYLGARIGMTMPGMNNSEATVILLQKS